MSRPRPNPREPAPETVTFGNGDGPVPGSVLSAGGDRIKHMSDMVGFREAGQLFMAAAWDTAHAATGAGDAPGVSEFLDVIEQIASQLAGLRLNTIDQARYLTGAAQILDSVTSSVADNVGRLRSQVRLATVLGEELPLIQAALQEGLISMPQAAAIADGLATLPATFGAVERAKCQTEILKHADSLGPAELRILAGRLVEYVDPEGAEAAEAARLAAEERRARRRRRLRLTPNHHGAMTISGKLPLADGALLAAQLEALMPPLASYQNNDELPDRQARTADALLLLAQIAANSGHLPCQGMDRPHIVLTLDHDTLNTGLGHITLPGHTDVLGAGDARRLACDAGILPIVLAGPSQLLDVGREERQFTKAIRAALTLRDGGCAFPGCTAVPAACEAHHIRPWWAGGHTALTNAVLLCPRHHRLIEPDPNQPEASQWNVHLDPTTGQPWFTPPAHIDPHRQPRQHRRQLINNIELEPDKATAYRGRSLPGHRTASPSGSTSTGTTTPRRGSGFQGSTMPTPRPLHRCRGGGSTSLLHCSTTTGTTTNPNTTAPSAQPHPHRDRRCPDTPATPTPGTPPDPASTLKPREELQFRWSSSARRGTSRARVETPAKSSETLTRSRHGRSFLAAYSISGWGVPLVE